MHDPTPHPAPSFATPHPRTLLATALVVVPLLLALLAGCDAAEGPPDPTGPDPLDPMTANQQALVTAAFEEVEGLFSLGFRADGARTSARTASGTAALASMRAMVDTTTYTGVYDDANAKGYLVTLQYRQPQGVGVWQARVQHAREIDHDQDPATTALDAVESVTLTFLDYPDLAAFVAALDAGAVGYLVGATDDAEASFAAYDTWRVAQVYSPAQGAAVVSYANQELRETVTVREPVITRNTNGTGTVRDGGDDGAVRTRYYGADFAVDAAGTPTGTLLRTLTSHGDAGDGSLVSLTRYPDGSFRQTRQRGGDGVVVRENTEG